MLLTPSLKLWKRQWAMVYKAARSATFTESSAKIVQLSEGTFVDELKYTFCLVYFIFKTFIVIVT